MVDIMCGDVSDWLDAESLATDLNLVALHRFLDGGADIANAHVDSSSLRILVSDCLGLDI